jgi:hypothetical protein
LETDMTDRRSPSPVLLTAQEIADACETSDTQMIRNLVKFDVIKPTIRGGRGRGLHHRFNVNQALALVICHQVSATPLGASWPGMKKLIKQVEAWPIEKVEFFLGLRDDPAIEEQFAKERVLFQQEMAASGRESIFPNDEKLADWRERTLNRLADVIRKKMPAQANRIQGKGARAAKK